MSNSQFTSEDFMREHFVTHVQERVWTRSNLGNFARLQYFESTCSSGRADWVWGRVPITLAESDFQDRHLEMLQQSTSSAIVASLSTASPRTYQFLHECCGVEERTFRRHLSQLLQSELITKSDQNQYFLNEEFWPSSIELVAFEFKKTNWRRALYQARRYRTFSHRVYVVLEPRPAEIASDYLQFFKQSGIGLLGYDPQGHVTIHLKSPKKSPLNRSSFIRACAELLKKGEPVKLERPLENDLALEAIR